jgi:hypothetical protein
MLNETLNHHPKPAEEHKRLGIFVGHWDTEGEVFESEHGPAAKIRATDTYEWMEGGFFLIHRATAIIGGQPPVHNLEIISYDPVRDTYPIRYFSSNGNHGAYEGTARYNGTWTYTGPTACATVTIGNGGDTIQAGWKKQSEDGAWHPWMNITLKKQKP